MAVSMEREVPVLRDNHSLSLVPCGHITANNVSNWWPRVMTCVRDSHFVAVDLELSGLGPRDRLNAKQIDDRYEGVVSAAKSRAVLSIGLAFFNFCDNDVNETTINTNSEINCDTNSSERTINSDNLNECLSDSVENVNKFEALLDPQLMAKLENESNGCVDSSDKQWKISAQVFNALCLCEEEYVCEPETMRFLAGHGFDFNGQCLHGLSYHRGNDFLTEYEDLTTPSLRNLIAEIIRHKLPIVLHNGFIDLIFLYQNFYSDLPQDLQTFIADLVELFPAGIFDTKYIADFHDRLNRSYLEYLFYERQRFNIERSMKGQISIDITFPSLSHHISSDIEFKDLSTKILSESDLIVDICYDYANHGWCKLNHTCSRSHNIDHILDQKKNRSKRMKKLIKNMKKKSEELRIESTSGGDNSSIESVNTKHSKQGVHRAGYDAFMTGYCFAFYIAINAKTRPNPSKPLCVKSLGISHIVNNIYLTGKDQSLRINASSFAKTSANHKNKIQRIRAAK
ncbi:unnamed protein product [Medioppia subpectinata]|uniref:C3H1-type domain-containing protein n=1 Tax=Medioppia subpectinata TaxID=1979941 RepID=A0A7R9KSS7_9ACAR|nr:unnamed protein product [Medioppia subpectinata]CAG2108761.1 unnamed protein product [Medioppia subpectinata]